MRLARQAVRGALKITKRYKAFRPHALREAGIVAALEGQEDAARRFFEQSLAVAESHEAKYDHAKTTLAWGEAGVQFGWPEAQEKVDQSRKIIDELEDMTGI